MNYGSQQYSAVTCRENSLPVSRKNRFKEDFPEIEDIIVEIKEIDYSGSGFKQTVRYNMDTIPAMGGHIDCSNNVCYEGGIAIGAMIRTMIHHKRSRLEKNIKCQGYTQTSRSRQKFRDCDCLHLFKVSINLKFKGSPDQ